MYPVKCNFRNQYLNNTLCNLCKIEEDRQEHLLECKVLEHFVPEIQKTNVQYKDIFGTIEQIIQASKLLLKVCKERESLLSLNDNDNEDIIIN